MRLQSKNKKLLLIPVAIILIIAAYFTYAALSRSVWPFARNDKAVTDTQSTANDSPTSEELDEQAKTDAKNKEDFLNSATDQEQTQSGQSSPNTDTTGDVKISISPYRQSNELVVVTTNLGPLPDGTCTLTVTNGTNKQEQTAEIIYQPDYSTCAGFSVPVSSLGRGTWDIRLSVNSRGTTYSTQESIVVK